MKNFKLLLTLALLAAFSFSYAQKETRNTESFDEISLGVHADLYLTIGSKQSVVIEGEDDDIDNIETEVENGRLRIRSKKSWNWNWGGDKVEIYITVPEVNGIYVSGSGSVHGESVIKSDDFDMSISGSGDINIEIDANSASLKISGSGHAELSGNAGELNIRISGSGSIEAYDLESNEVEASISGSGSARVNVSESIEASIAGSGSIYYTGDPDNVNSSTAGSGRVRKKG